MKNTPKRGRPTKYNGAITVASFKAACELGATDDQLCKIFNLSVQSLATWKKKHPEFLESLKDGKAIADEAVEKSLFQRALGYSHPDTHFATVDGNVIQTPTVKHYPPEVTACIFWLKNRKPGEWRDKITSEISGPEGGPIPMELMTREQLRAELKRRGAITEREGQ